MQEVTPFLRENFIEQLKKQPPLMSTTKPCGSNLAGTSPKVTVSLPSMSSPVLKHISTDCPMSCNRWNESSAGKRAVLQIAQRVNENPGRASAIQDVDPEEFQEDIVDHFLDGIRDKAEDDYAAFVESQWVDEDEDEDEEEQ